MYILFFCNRKLITMLKKYTPMTSKKRVALLCHSLRNRMNYEKFI